MEITSELDALATHLDENRAACRWKAKGISEDLGRRPAVDSGTSILGTIKHLGYVERWWYQAVIAGAEVEFPWTEDDPKADWRVDEEETVESILAFFDGEVSISRQIHSGLTTADAIVAMGEEHIPIRKVLLHMLEEVARHAGHLDILREQADGLTGVGPPSDDSIA